MKRRPYKLFVAEGEAGQPYYLRDEIGRWWVLIWVEGGVRWRLCTTVHGAGCGHTHSELKDVRLDAHITEYDRITVRMVQNLVWQYRWMFIDPLALKVFDEQHNASIELPRRE
jgi:hypothetical protein